MDTTALPRHELVDPVTLDLDALKFRIYCVKDALSKNRSRHPAVVILEAWLTRAEQVALDKDAAESFTLALGMIGA